MPHVEPGEALARREHGTGAVRTAALSADPAVSEVRELHDGDSGSGRISSARQFDGHSREGLFPVGQLARIDEALTFAERDTGVRFSVYLGDLSSSPRARAETMLRGLGAAAEDSCLLAISPGERVVEVVTGTRVARRIDDRAAGLAVTAMASSFKEGDLVGGVLAGLRMLADSAGYR